MKFEHQISEGTYHALGPETEGLCFYSGIPIFRIFDYSKLPILRTKSRFPWICYSQTL